MLLNTYVIDSADKDPNNIVSVYKSHYVDCLIKELGIDNSLGNPTYTPTALTKEEIMDKHRYILCSLGISTKDEELDLPYYWIPNLNKCLFKNRFIAGSDKCSTKLLSKYILSAFQSYCHTSFSMDGANRMWILKNAKDLLEYIQSRSLSSCNIINTCDFFNIYTTFSHSKLKDKLRSWSNCVS